MGSQSPDTKIKAEAPVRAPSPVPVDDAVLPFEIDALDLRGRLTRLGPALDDILTKHDYPAPVCKLLGEAIVLTTLLGSSLKFDGRFILQTQTDGPVSFLIVDFQAPDKLRAYARFDAARLKEGQNSASAPAVSRAFAAAPFLADRKAHPGRDLFRAQKIFMRGVFQGAAFQRHQPLIAAHVRPLVDGHGKMALAKQGA